ncbi:hypothetical protein [Pontibacillus marinus]|nr:hypothetical protein [Pontibacillus marinus]
MFVISVVVFILYYLPIISKDLHKITKQNQEIIELLQKSIKDKD